MTSTLDLTQYADKKVIVQYKADDGTLQEVEGTVQTANSLGLLLKPKGKANVDIIEAANIENVEYVPEAPKKISVRWIKDVTPDTARAHLVDRHAADLSEVNAMSDQEAYEIHEAIDHSTLGHRHGEKPKRGAQNATEGVEGGVVGGEPVDDDEA